jgi:hypothetical protein
MKLKRQIPTLMFLGIPLSTFAVVFEHRLEEAGSIIMINPKYAVSLNLDKES